MKLLTKEIIARLPKLYATENTPKAEKMVQAKFFTPTSGFTWYVIEGEPVGDTWELFTFTKSQHCPEGELGYAILSELESVKGPFGLGVERDLHFTPCKLSEVMQG